MTPASHLIAVAGIAARWGVTEPVIHTMLQRGELPGFKVGRVWRVNLADVEAYETRPVAAPVEPTPEPEKPVRSGQLNTNPSGLAKRWGVSTTMVYDLLNSGKLRGHRIGDLWRIRLSDVEEYESRDATASPPPPEPPEAPPSPQARQSALRIARLTGEL